MLCVHDKMRRPRQEDLLNPGVEGQPIEIELTKRIRHKTTGVANEARPNGFAADSIEPFVHDDDERLPQTSEERRQQILTKSKPVPLREHLKQHDVIRIGRGRQLPIT
jgi:hypothetical protein